MRVGRRLVLITAMTLALAGPAAAAAASSVSAATVASSQGWVRCADLAPGAAQDVFLYPFGNPSNPIELTEAGYGYGSVSDYMPVGSGQYTVAIRQNGASSASTPSVSTSFMISAGTSYTVASIGSGTNRKLEVLQDQVAGAGSKVLVRVFQASLKQSHVTVSVGSDVIASQLAFGTASGYQDVPAGKSTVTFSAAGAKVSMPVTLTAGSVHSIFVLDGSSGLRVDNVTDAAASADTPDGGAATGFGGMAPPPPGPGLMPWVGTLAGGALLVTAGVFALRRLRRGGLVVRD